MGDGQFDLRQLEAKLNQIEKHEKNPTQKLIKLAMGNLKKKHLNHEISNEELLITFTRLKNDSRLVEMGGSLSQFEMKFIKTCGNEPS